MINIDGKEVSSREICEKGVFLDLEHYVYKKPIGVVVFGACIFDKNINELQFLQYMMENRGEKQIVLSQAEEYLRYMYECKGKRYIITFSGNNDFLVLKHLSENEMFDFNVVNRLKHVDIQKEYEKFEKKIIGLKKLEEIMNIQRESEVLNGAKIARTFGKIFSKENYRMANEKRDKLLLYNQQDVLSLYYIMEKWKSMFLNKEEIIESKE
ncbi:ribonuclease H-like domain-containing protein [Oceanirhabdus sp. W0125-5]|uniref:ribonuclease H-like domain-containing protein n=1 Tax=Oceanirhabdus sp. W0125-5 TaxID=2999116 RepID=UPI0022F2AC9A|nr:ribonuclease H-like domain-containing protein [Oceanirhabdus sp. W0125-5]WBW96152.1 ribonuclease H-like domain-containing protein [Oceanirhabdus sp. W0125-5]